MFATGGDGGDPRRLSPLGAEVLQRLRGMFAFAVDTVTRRCCARDPFGIKPLFIATGAGGTAVLGEKIPAGPRWFDLQEIDHRGVAALHRLRYVPGQTLHREVRRLESGCFRPGSRADQRSPVISCRDLRQSRSPALTRPCYEARSRQVLEDSVAKHTAPMSPSARFTIRYRLHGHRGN